MTEPDRLDEIATILRNGIASVVVALGLIAFILFCMGFNLRIIAEKMR